MARDPRCSSMIPGSSGARAAAAMLLLVALAPVAAGGHLLYPFPSGDPELQFSGEIPAHGGCVGFDLPPDSGGKAYHLLGPNTTRSDYTLVFEHEEGAPFLQGDLKRAGAAGRTVVNDFVGGGSEVVVAPTREVGVVPAGSTRVLVCARDTLDSWTEHYVFRLAVGPIGPERFLLRLGGTLPPAVPVILSEGAAYPAQVEETVLPGTGRAGPFDAGSYVLPTLSAYRKVTLGFSRAAGASDIFLAVCEDRDQDGSCSPTDPVSTGCVRSHPLHPSLMTITTTGSGGRLLVSASLAGSGPVGPCTGGMVPRPDSLGDLWYTQCLPGYTASCRPFGPGDPV